MIRFNCPNCSRHYELHPALAHLPLLCKQCGERITPPDPQPDPEPEPPPPPKPVAPPKPAPAVAAPPPPKVAPQPPKAPAKPPPPAPKPVPPPPAVEEDEDDGVLLARPDEGPDIDFNVGGPTAASLSDAARARPADLDNTRGGSAPTAPASVPDIAFGLPVPAKPAAPKRPAKPAPPPAPEPAAEPRPTSGLLPFLADAAAFVVLLVGGMLLGELLARKPTGAVLSEAGSAPKFPPVDLLMWAGPPLLLALLYLLLSSRKLSLGARMRTK